MFPVITPWSARVVWRWRCGAPGSALTCASASALLAPGPPPALADPILLPHQVVAIRSEFRAFFQTRGRLRSLFRQGLHVPTGVLRRRCVIDLPSATRLAYGFTAKKSIPMTAAVIAGQPQEDAAVCRLPPRGRQGSPRCRPVTPLPAAAARAVRPSRSTINQMPGDTVGAQEVCLPLDGSRHELPAAAKKPENVKARRHPAWAGQASSPVSPARVNRQSPAGIGSEKGGSMALSGGSRAPLVPMKMGHRLRLRGLVSRIQAKPDHRRDCVSPLHVRLCRPLYSLLSW
jgi:hypothetical protein